MAGAVALARRRRLGPSAEKDRKDKRRATSPPWPRRLRLRRCQKVIDAADVDALDESEGDVASCFR
jgi:hypothetical protein